MSAVRFSAILLLGLSACGGNPISGGGGGGGGTSTSVATLPTAGGTPSASSSIERHEAEVTDGKSKDLGNGFAFKDGKIHYDSTNDTFTVDNLAFDGANVYQRDATMDGTASSDVKTYAGDGTATDNQSGATIDQFSYRALYGESTSGRSHFAIVRTGAYDTYGFGGFVYTRTGGVTLPKTGQAQYNGSYTGLRDHNGSGGMEFVTADMQMNIDFEDFNADESATKNGAGIVGTISNRHIYDLTGADITAAVVAEIDADKKPDGGITDLPILQFKVGPGVLDNNGEAQGSLSSVLTISGVTKEFESGKYYAVVSGSAADEVVGVIVVTGDINSVTARETGGFILYRQ